MAERTADREVEDTLREIRERVRAESSAARGDPAEPARDDALAPSAAAPDGAAVVNAPPSPAAGGRSSAALARMEANLSTTERARERLPPLMSYREGLAARLELWLKRQVKRAFHWFTWEQVNFNSAAHHALADAREALAAHEQLLARALAELDSLRASHQQALQGLQAEIAAARERAEARDADAKARLAAAESRLSAESAQLRDRLAATAGELRAELRAAAEGLRAEARGEREAQINALQNEFRERVGHLQEEQRVCFRQLSLETTESAVMHDRARRLLEARIERVEKDVNRES